MDKKQKPKDEELLVQLSSRGQITLPLDIRKSIGLKPGDPLRARIEDGRIVLEPVVVLPVELYTDERVTEFAKAAELTPAELAEARGKWQQTKT